MPQVTPHTFDVTISAGALRLPGILTIPEGASGLILFAHGSGSGRLSPRNAQVAEKQHDAGFATLLFDLLTPTESADRDNVFDIPLLAERLLAATRFAEAEHRTLPIGYFGASTGAAAALVAASKAPDTVRAIVSRGGRPDLADDRLPLVPQPTLLIVGGLDQTVLELNRQASARMRCIRRLVVVPGAGHLFEEGDTLLEVARLAQGWFRDHLVSTPPSSTRPI